MKKFRYTFLLLLFAPPLAAQQYSVSAIPDSLKKDAVAIVRYSSQEFRQENVNSGIYTIKLAVTILHENGRKHADFVSFEDNFRELKSFSGELLDASGKTIKKIPKKDLRQTAYSSDLANDKKYIYYECHAPVYPFTVKYEYVIKYKNGILMYPTFMPITTADVALEQAEYRLQVPAENIVRYKLQGNIASPECLKQKDDSVFRFTLNHLNAINYEPYSPTEKLYPYALLSPAKFCVSNVCGDMSNWESFGKWQQQLLAGRDNLPPQTIAKIQELTAEVSDAKEKVGLVYDFLQRTTRYVSIQLGIGGWQPMPAAEVAKTGFGDCKALSNYMMAMLAAIDIPSYYVIISTVKERFFRDYPNFSQANHVILMVPLKTDTLWLECTSNTLPFGYTHSNIAGHDALAIGKDTAFFCTLPLYPPALNKTINNVNIQLQPNGWADIAVQSNYHLRDYENISGRLRGLSNQEELNLLARQLAAHKPKIQNISKKETKSDKPQFDLSYTAQCEDYAQSTQSRLIVPILPVQNRTFNSFTAASRRNDIKISNGVNQIDSVSIAIPAGYSIENLPEPTNIPSKYGSIVADVRQTEDKIIYTQQITIFKGYYTVEEYEEIKQFFKQINTLKSKTVVFRKEGAK